MVKKPEEKAREDIDRRETNREEKQIGSGLVS
jgi:hypothetical protein